MSLASIIQLVNDKLRSTVLADLAPGDLVARAVGQAVLQYGTDVPQELALLVTGSGDVFPVPVAWVQGISELEALEYPVGLAPMATLTASVAQDLAGVDKILLQADSLPDGSQVRVHFTAPHAADGSTVPAAHENALACWATSEMCRQAATRFGFDRDASIGAANVNQQSQGAELARRATEWLAQYYAQLGLRNPTLTSGSGASAAALGSGVKAAGTITSFACDGRRRARFSSQGL